MKEIEQLIEISQKYGKDSRYVIAGGGNTSYKNEEKLWVKASGCALATITEDGFAVLDRKKLNVISEKTYSSDTATREEEVKNDLAAACLTKDRRPSVETSMHNALSASFIVHLHPTMVNGLMCAQNAEAKTAELFGNDAVYVPTDNTVAANTGIVDGICRPAKKPVFAGEEGICAGCGVATLSISYYDLGYKTGEMAAQILKGEADISQMPIEYANASKLYNADMCQELGITVPEGYTALEG